jgi:hypothetical protein
MVLCRTRIRLELAIYFCLHKGSLPEDTERWQAEKGESVVKYREIIADNLSKAGWSWGCVSAIDSNGRTIFVADAHRGDGSVTLCVRKKS